VSLLQETIELIDKPDSHYLQRSNVEYALLACLHINNKCWIPAAFAIVIFQWHPKR